MPVAMPVKLRLPATRVGAPLALFAVPSPFWPLKLNPQQNGMLAKVTPQDYVIDLGSGDGRIVITAAKKYGARGFGVDLNPVRIKESRRNADTAGVAGKMKFVNADLFQQDLSPASVVTLYLLPLLIVRLRPKLFRDDATNYVAASITDLGTYVVAAP